MRLSMLLSILDALLQNILSLLDKQSMQINGIVRNTSRGVVLAEDKLRRLLVVLIAIGLMAFALLRKIVGSAAVPTLVRLPRPLEARLHLSLLATRQVAQTIVLLLGRAVGSMVEGYIGAVSDASKRRRASGTSGTDCIVDGMEYCEQPKGSAICQLAGCSTGQWHSPMV